MTALGLVLLVLGSAVAIAEAHYPTHGVAGSGGVALLAVGAVLAISGAGAGLALALVIGVLLAGAGATGMGMLLRSSSAVRRQRIRTGAEGIVGHVGIVRSWADSAGSVLVDGALWTARRSPCVDPEDEQTPLHSGDHIVVERLTGLTLSVRPAESWELL